MRELFSLGELYVSDFIKDGEKPRGPKTELKLMMTDNGNVRLEKTAPLDTMFGTYWYRSGINSSMKKELKNIVDSILLVKKLQKDDVWIDVASNDGSLLSFIPKDIIRIGIDPADNTFKQEAEKHANIIVQDYFSAKNYQSTPYGHLKAKVITSIAMFYDLEKPEDFIKDVYDILDDNGLWVLQLSYTPLMLKQLAFDNMCFTPNTFISGINKKISELKENDEVLDFNGNYTKVKKIFNRQYNGDIFNIKALYMNNIETTPEHPFLIVKKENIDSKKNEWVEAKNIKNGDFLLLPKIKTKNIDRNINLLKYNNIKSPNYRRGLKNIYLTDDILWMMGLYVAEGHLSGRENNLQINFTLNKNELHYALKIKETFASFGYKTIIRENKISNSLNIQSSCTSLAKMFREWFGTYAINKKIPDFIFTAKSDVTIPFLNGLIDGDGCIGKADQQVGLHSASKVLIYQVQLMLATLNAMTGISYIQPYPCTIRGMPVKSKDSWQLRGKGNKLDEIFLTNYSKVREKKSYLFDDNYIYLPVKNIKKTHYDGMVHNFETENNTYVVSNIVVHNCHEHVYYYSLFNLKKLFNDNGFQIVDCQLNDVNGGSFRVYAMKNNADIKTFASQPHRDICNFRIDSLLEYEKTLALDSVDTWKDFYNRINELKEKTVSFIKEKKAEGKVIYGYGASTKGNTLLQYFGLDYTLIDKIAERNPQKYGLKTVGTNIPICSEEEMRIAKPDFLLVLPWHFISEFQQREKEYIDNGGAFIVPCPKFEIIGK